MRILSQENLNMDYDIPYEQVCLNINKKSEKSFRIYAWHSLSDSDDGCYLVAEYSTKTKAKKAMEMLRNICYESELSKVFHDGTTFLTTHFQFPKDDEIND